MSCSAQIHVSPHKKGTILKRPLLISCHQPIRAPKRLEDFNSKKLTRKCLREWLAKQYFSLQGIFDLWQVEVTVLPHYMNYGEDFVIEKTFVPRGEKPALEWKYARTESVTDETYLINTFWLTSSFKRKLIQIRLQPLRSSVFFELAVNRFLSTAVSFEHCVFSPTGDYKRMIQSKEEKAKMG